MKLVWHWPYTDERGDHCTLELVDNDGFQVDTADLADYLGAWDAEDPYVLAEADLLKRNGIGKVITVVYPW